MVFHLGPIIFIVVVFAIGFAVYQMNQMQNPREGFVARVKLYSNLRTGYKCKLDTDLNNPEDFIRTDPQTPTQLFILREPKGIFDRGDRRVNLSQHHLIKRYEGFTEILDEVNEVEGELANKLESTQNQLKITINSLAEHIAENNKLKNKKDETMKEYTEQLEKMNEASRKGIPMQKPKQVGYNGR